MLGGAASAKTASYTLVAADAGTAISMSNASATTITVNTALFAAGDTVQITNLGVGVCTITAGTATVDTSASLALAQYESGTLDFTSTSAAIFIKGAGAAAAGGGMTLINTGGTTLTGASITISSIPDTYINLFVIIRANKPATDGAYLMMRMNGDSTANRYFRTNWSGEQSAQAFDGSLVEIASDADNGTANGLVQLTFYDYANTTTFKYAIGSSFNNNVSNAAQINLRTRQLFYNQTAAISSLTFFPDSGNFTSGTVFVYGVK